MPKHPKFHPPVFFPAEVEQELKDGLDAAISTLTRLRYLLELQALERKSGRPGALRMISGRGRD